jgi:hypothetical protein
MPIKFHLLERTEIRFNLRNTISYIGEQSALTGPVIFILLSILYKPVNTFQKVLKLNVIGIFLFFLFISFFEIVNTHWTAIAWIPMLCLSYLQLSRIGTRKLIRSLIVANFILVFCFRLNLIFNWFTIPHFNDLNPVIASEELKKLSDDKPLVFINVYNEPSFYMFYNNQSCFAINTIDYKRTQFNFWSKYERFVQGKTVNTICYYKLHDNSRPLTIEKGKTYYIDSIPDFRSFFTSITVEAPDLNITLNAGEKHIVNIKLIHDLKPEELKSINENGFYILLTLINDRTKERFTFECPLNLNPDKKSEIEIVLPETPGFYKSIFSIYNKRYPIVKGFNSETYYVKINSYSNNH